MAAPISTNFVACYVCGSSTSIHEHHIVPQARGGTEGPVIDLCANCHGLIHTVARAMQRGRSGDDKLAHLSEAAINRARVLVQMILLAHVGDATNPRPLVSAVLDDPRYLDALKRYQFDSGFTSQEAAINGIFKALAVRYGLADDVDAQRVGTRAKLRDLGKKP